MAITWQRSGAVRVGQTKLIQSDYKEGFLDCLGESFPSLQDVSNKVCSTEGRAVTPRGASFKVEQTSVAARAESE